MQTYELIVKKRDGKTLTPEEIEFIIDGYVGETIPDYQVAALTMAIYFQGMSKEETVALTRALVKSGETIDLSDIEGIKVDKHSTGGVGDKVTLVLIPLLAALGFRVAKMSGRGLGHTGGTVDKLEGIPGFRIDLTNQEFREQVNSLGAAIIGQTANLAPGDKKLYGLRDVTGTVDSIPLIASSIMSKKIAGGASNIVLDVKFGKGAFMQDLEQARHLAQTMVEIARGMGRKARAVLSCMEQPLGRAVGNNIEVMEAQASLEGKGPADLKEVVMALAVAAYQMEKPEMDTESIQEKIEKCWQRGQARDKFFQLVQAQGGVLSEKLPLAPEFILEAQQEGYVQGLDARSIGRASMVLGAGRRVKEEKINHEVGILLHKKIGDWVDKGENLAAVYAPGEGQFKKVEAELGRAWSIQKERKDPPPLIDNIIG